MNAPAALATEHLMLALEQCVHACGGAKRIGQIIFPGKGIEEAQRALLSALNVQRPERLTPQQLVALFRAAHDRGYHAGIAVFCELAGYAPPQPVTTADEAAELHRQFLRRAEEMHRLVERLEQLQSAPTLRSAA